MSLGKIDYCIRRMDRVYTANISRSPDSMFQIPRWAWMRHQCETRRGVAGISVSCAEVVSISRTGRCCSRRAHTAYLTYHHSSILNGKGEGRSSAFLPWKLGLYYGGKGRPNAVPRSHAGATPYFDVKISGRHRKRTTYPRFQRAWMEDGEVVPPAA
jgi:hypothetical protein